MHDKPSGALRLMKWSTVESVQTAGHQIRFYKRNVGRKATLSPHQLDEQAARVAQAHTDQHEACIVNCYD
jgi:hypothetical protein